MITQLRQFLQAIANAIKTKKGYSSSATINAQDFRDEILSIPTGGQPVLQNKTVTANGAYTPDSGYDGLGTVTVVIPEYDGEVQ